MRFLLLLFTLLLSSISFGQSLDGPCLRIFDNPDEAFDIRRQVIINAKEEIVMSYYALANEVRPMNILRLLKEAVDRGVKVRLLLDDYNSKLPTEMRAFLKNNHIETRFYNVLKIKNIGRIDRRMHDKYVVIDRKYLLVGGRNLKDGYFKLKVKEEQTFYDLDVLLTGQPAIEAADYFEERWVSPLAEERVIKKINEDKYTDLEEKIFRTYDEIEALDGMSLSDEKAALSECQDTSFYAYDPNDKLDNESIQDIYIREIENAQTSIDIQNAYVILTKPMQKAIRAAAERGVRVRIVTNSLKTADVTMSYSAFRNLRPKLMKWGVEIYEFTQNDTLHTKLAIFDNKRFIVGSFNLDPRSANINSETIILSGDKQHAELIQEFYDETLELSARINEKGRHEGTNKRHPGTTFGKRLLNSILRFTLVPILRGRL